MKVMKVVDPEGRFMGYRFNCPGCGDKHLIPLRPVPQGFVESPDVTPRAHWYFSGTEDSPTFSPSVHIRTGHYAGESLEECWCSWVKDNPEDQSVVQCYICHSFVRDGQIEFLNDSTHALAGQKVTLPEIE